MTKVSITSHRNYTSRLMHTHGNAKIIQLLGSKGLQLIAFLDIFFPIHRVYGIGWVRQVLHKPRDVCSPLSHHCLNNIHCRVLRLCDHSAQHVP